MKSAKEKKCAAAKRKISDNNRWAWCAAGDFLGPPTPGVGHIRAILPVFKGAMRRAVVNVEREQKTIPIRPKAQRLPRKGLRNTARRPPHNPLLNF